MELSLAGLTVLVGPNAAGKSNLLDALRLLQDGLREDLRTAVQRRGDRAVLFMGAHNWGAAFEVELDCWVPSLPRTQLLDYHIQYDWRYLPAGWVREESLSVRRTRTPGELTSVFDARDGKGVVFGNYFASQPDVSTPEPGLLVLKAVSYLDRFKVVRELRDYIESWRFLQPDVTAIRAPRRSSREERLDVNAGNLANVLRTLDESKSVALSRITDDLKTLLHFVDGVRTDTERGQVSLLLRERGRATDLESLSLSDGTLRLLAILTALHTLPAPGLLCIEEPEHGLHPSLLGALVGAARSVCPKGSQRQVVMTTHSPELVDHVEPDEIRPLERGEDGATVLLPLDTRQLRRWLKDFRLGELWRMRRIGGMP